MCRQCGHHQYWGDAWCYGCGYTIRPLQSMQLNLEGATRGPTPVTCPVSCEVTRCGWPVGWRLIAIWVSAQAQGTGAPPSKAPFKAPPATGAHQQRFSTTLSAGCVGGAASPMACTGMGAINVAALSTQLPSTARLVNLGKDAEELLVHPHATSSQVVLNRREVVGKSPGRGSPWWYSCSSDRSRSSSQSPTRAPWSYFESATAVAKALWKRATAPTSGGSPRVTKAQLLIIRPLLPSDFTEDPTPASGAMQAESSGRPASDPAPKKARGLREEDRPMAIIIPTGEALWFTTRDLNQSTPRLVIPWSMFQHLVMSRGPLCGLQSWGKVGVIVILH